MKKRYRAIAAVLSVAMLMSGCAGKTDEPKEETSQEEVQEEEISEEASYQAKLDEIVPSAYNNASGLELEPGTYISIIGKSSENPYWEEVKKGVAKAAEDINAELGYEGKDKVKVTFSAPDTPDNVDEQVSLLDEELARYPISVGISIADTQACEVQFDIANENSIPVIAFDSGSEYEGLQATISTDNKAAGVLAANQMAEMIGGSGQIALFIHDSSSMAARERENAFVNEIQTKYPDIVIASILHLDDLDEIKLQIQDEISREMYVIPDAEGRTEEDELSTEDVVDYIIDKYPNITGCFATNRSSTQAAVASIEKLGREEISLIGFDAGEEQIQALEEGKIDGLVVQNPFAMGYAAVIASARAGLGIGNEAFVNTGYTWVTRENMETPDVAKLLY